LNTVSNGYYVDPRSWATWETVIGMLQDSGYLAYELTDDGKDYGYRVEVALASIAINEYKIAQTYTPSNVFEAFIENELSFD
jgi:hypothetical protein